MGVDVNRQHEDGVVIESVNDLHEHLAKVLCAADLEKTACLRFVDPYGDTKFNQLQIPVLLRELEALASGGLEPAQREHLLRVVEVVRRALEQVHVYVEFVGD